MQLSISHSQPPASRPASHSRSRRLRRALVAANRDIFSLPSFFGSLCSTLLPAPCTSTDSCNITDLSVALDATPPGPPAAAVAASTAHAPPPAPALEVSATKGSQQGAERGRIIVRAGLSNTSRGPRPLLSSLSSLSAAPGPHGYPVYSAWQSPLHLQRRALKRITYDGIPSETSAEWDDAVNWSL